jgi:hypothetical protein
VLIVHDFGIASGGAANMSLVLRKGLDVRGHEARIFASRARPLSLEIVAHYTCYGTMGQPRRFLQVANPGRPVHYGKCLENTRPMWFTYECF